MAAYIFSTIINLYTNAILLCIFYEKHERYNTPDLLKGKNRPTEYTYKKMRPSKTESLIYRIRHL